MSYLKQNLFIGLSASVAVFLLSCGTGINVSSDLTNFPASPTSTFVSSGLAGPTTVVTAGGLTVVVRASPNAFPKLSSQDSYQISDLYLELESQNILNR